MQYHPIGRSLLMFLASVLFLAAAHAGQISAPPQLGQFLDEHGLLHIPQGSDVVIDPSGFKLASDQEGGPRFQPLSQGPAAPGEWEGIGALPFGCNDGVRAMVRMDSGDIFLGGQFTQCGGLAVNHIVRYDPVANTFHALDNGVAVGVNEWVWALAASGEDLYVGGFFTHAGGQEVNHIARWDGAQWHGLPGLDDVVGVDSGVEALALAGDDLFVGGGFNQAGGQTANHIARWDISQQEWHALISGGENGVNGVVHALTTSGDSLFVGGGFWLAGNAQSLAVAHWDRTEQDWQAMPGLDERVYALAMSGDDLYVGGAFTWAGAQRVNGVARWDGSQWHALAGPDGAGVSGSSDVRSLAVVGDDLYVGGFFTRAGSSSSFAGGVQALGVARWDGSDWHALAEPEGFPGLFGAFFDGFTVPPGVLAMAAHGDELFLGGFFIQAGGRDANRVARWSQASA